MTKDYLEALENMKNGASDWYGSYEMHEDYPVVKSALQRLEAIDKAEPSEALKKLEKYLKWLERHEFFIEISDGKHEKCSDIIKQALQKAQEQEKENIEYKKVLKIIMENNVDVQYLRYEVANVKMYNDYVSQLNKVSTINHSSLNEEDFELLKRYFK